MPRTGNDQFTDTTKYPTDKMEVNGLACKLNMPRALQSETDGDGVEIAQRLPEHNERPCFVVDEHPACPESWMHGSATEASYFVPVLPEHGLWLDFNGNCDHTHHVAVVISIQGVNAITGQPTEDFALEQYRNNCPVHNKPFGHKRFCEDCGFQWDSQNYLAGNATPSYLFWLDGFRAKDGAVRQFYFTEETMRGVAAQVIGDRRVFAIGVAFYLSKKEKPKRVSSGRVPGLDFAYGMKGGGFGSSRSIDVLSLSSLGSDVFGSSDVVEEPQLEIAAGARIDQRIYPDAEKLDFWRPDPEGILYVNYAPNETVLQILEGGRRDMTAEGEGFMKELAVGNQ